MIAGNDNYIFGTKVFLNSLLNNADGEFINIYFLYNNLKNDNIEELKILVGRYEETEITFIYIDKKLFKDAPTKALTNPYITLETYFRMAMSEVLPRDLDRILYLDTDIIINKPIRNFYKTPFDDKAAVVCDDYGLIMAEKIRKRVYRNLELSDDDSYFNAGVMLINLDYMRNHYSIGDFIEYISQHYDNLIFHDQDVLNAMLNGKVKYEDYNIYNCRPFYYPYTKRGSENVRKASIIHYGEKPWNEDFSDLGGSIFWKNALRAGYKSQYEAWKRKNNEYRRRKFITLALKHMKRNIKDLLVKNGKI